MIGLVIVSHSARLAEGVCELASQVAQGGVRLAPAGGTGDAASPIGTNAFLVAEAIRSLAEAEAVLVLMDLGSALLAAETNPRRRPAAATVVWIMMIAGFAVTATAAGRLLDPYSPARLVAVCSGVSLIALAVAAAVACAFST